MIVVHPDHPFAKKNFVEAKDLDGQAYLNRTNCEYRGFAGDISLARRVVPACIAASATTGSWR